MSYDSAAWGALASALSILLGVVTFFRWRRSGLVAGLRGAAWTILPIAAWLTGVLELGFDLADSIGHWALHLVFSPVVWLGILLAGVSAALFGASALLDGRRRESGPPAALNPAKGSPAGRSGGGVLDDDLGDIEAILRKHGIS